MVYTEPEERPSWGPHARDAFHVGRAPLHYRLKEFYMCDTHGFTTAVRKIYPAHGSDLYLVAMPSNRQTHPRLSAIGHPWRFAIFKDGEHFLEDLGVLLFLGGRCGDHASRYFDEIGRRADCEISL